MKSADMAFVFKGFISSCFPSLHKAAAAKGKSTRENQAKGIRDLTKPTIMELIKRGHCTINLESIQIV